ncbi:MAG: hypothetical protein HON76_17420 [Candidatus Scalindua sp.]|jgi:hypothetical protein|nr:hypothetical protein [Candidatus Scalindua sp.]MBT5305101.1 hypothetical protein [Candidatus Scalindua sp.]MBT6051079.1 hypothetical protein [Candidatus Scalindua sp.]MBT6229710.1 hypothetical protein [Candidatus Scalindua sp.]MBT6564299.1 hypothetical protein [Candidatus Scalindua sp.]
MKVEEKDSDNRVNTRLDLALEISLPDKNGKTVNISASGVCFEVITDDIDAFAVGTEFPIEIAAVTTTPGFEERKIKLDGNGCIVRSDVKEVTSLGNKLCIALKFKETLSIVPNTI